MNHLVHRSSGNSEQGHHDQYILQQIKMCLYIKK